MSNFNLFRSLFKYDAAHVHIFRHAAHIRTFISRHPLKDEGANVRSGPGAIVWLGGPPSIEPMLKDRGLE